MYNVLAMYILRETKLEMGWKYKHLDAKKGEGEFAVIVHWAK